MQVDVCKFASLCVHDFQKSLTNEVEIDCQDRPNLKHRITQLGRICNKCSQIIQDSVRVKQPCIVCNCTLETYLSDREFCPHEDRQYDDLVIKCMNSKEESHQIALSSKVCRRCSDKIRASLLNSESCSVCDETEKDLMHSLKKAFTSGEFSQIKNIISILTDKQCPESVFRNQIQSYCKALPLVAPLPNSPIPPQIKAEHATNDQHKSKRYLLYPKCQKHKEEPIYVCNGCLVALLNLNCCPFGCKEKERTAKVKKEMTISRSEAGFLGVYPQTCKDGYFLDLFVIRQIEQHGRLDQWESALRKVRPDGMNELKYQSFFPMYASGVQTSRRNYIMTGGVLGINIKEMKPTANCFGLILSEDTKTFQIVEASPMISPRASHSSVFLPDKGQLFVVGGFIKETGFLKTAEVYFMEQNLWANIQELNVARSKASLIVGKDHIYAFGGLSSDPKINEFICEKYSPITNTWTCVNYNGFDVPFLTAFTASTSLDEYRNKENIIIFGGSNNQQYNNLAQSLQLANESFSLNQKYDYSKMEYLRAGCTLGKINKDIILCFGGVNEYDFLLSVDAIKVRETNSEILPVFVYQKLELGSYRAKLREGNNDLVYKRIYSDLKGIGLMEEEKLQGGESKVYSPYNAQTLEKMEHTVGRTHLWVPL